MDCTALLNTFEDYLRDARLKEAADLLTNLKTRLAAGEDVCVDNAELSRMQQRLHGALEDQITALSTAIGAALRTAETTSTPLDELQNDIDQYAALVRLLPDYSDFSLKSFQRRLTDLRVRRRQLALYQQVQAEVQALWEQAERLSLTERMTSADVLLAFYTRACELVREARATDPENPNLSGLLAEAEKRRDRINNETGKMTSGAQSGQFLDVLDRIDAANDAEGIMVYDLESAPIGRMTKAEAMRFVQEQARAYVKSKVVEYVDKAEAYNRAANPRAALAELDRYTENFRQLEDRVPNLLKQSERDGLNNARQAAYALLQPLEAAEATIAGAVQQAERDPIGAWETYVTAYASSPAVVHSQAIRDAGNTLAEALRQKLQADHADASKLYAAEELASARRQLDDLLKRYDRFDVLKTWPDYTALRELFAQVTERITRKETAAERLKAAAAQPDAGKALAALEQIEQDYSDLIGLLPDSERLRAGIRARSNAQQELDRLRTFFDRTDLASVTNAVATARQLGDSDNPKQVDFRELANQLEHHLDYLKAEEAISTSLEAVRDALTQLSRRANLPKSIKDKTTARLAEVTTELTELNRNGEVIAAAKRVLSKSPPDLDSAWSSLAEVNRFRDAQQRADWGSTLTLSLGLLRENFRNPFSLGTLQTVLLQASSHGLNEDNRLFIDLRSYRLMQEARDLMTRNPADWSAVVNKWHETASETLRDVERTYVADQLRISRKREHQQLHDQLLSRAQQVQTGQYARENLIAQLQAETTALADLAPQWQDNPIDRVDAAIWSINLDLVRAELTPDTAQRDQLLISVATRARTLDLDTAIQRAPADTSRADREPVLRQYKNQHLSLWEQAETLGQRMREVESTFTLTATSALLADVVKKWTEFETSTAAPQAFDRFKTWYNQRLEAFRNTLLHEIAQFAADTRLTPEQLQRYDLLNIIDPTHPTGQQFGSRLQTFVDGLHRAIEDLLKGLPNGSWPTDLGSQTTLNQMIMRQRERLTAESAQLKRLSEIAQQTADRLGDRLGGQADSTGQAAVNAAALTAYSRLLENVQGCFAALEIATNQLDELIRSDACSDDWQTYADSFSQRSAAAREAIGQASTAAAAVLRDQQLGVDLPSALASQMQNLPSTHPQIMQLIARATAATAAIRTTSERLTRLQTVIAEEAFEAFASRADAIAAEADEDSTFFKRGLTTYFSVTVPDGEVTLTGWPAIAQYVRDRQQRWQRIMEWAAPFLPRNFTLPALDEIPADEVPVGRSWERTQNVISWDEWKAAVQMLRSRARFKHERALIHYLLHGPDGQTEALLNAAAALSLDDAQRTTTSPDEQGFFSRARQSIAAGELLPLRQAQATIDRFVIASDGSTTTEVARALSAAGSRRGRYLIRLVKHERQDTYANDISAAETRLGESQSQQARWEALLTELGPELDTLARLREGRSGLFGKRIDRAALRQQEAKCKSLLADLESIAPDAAEVAAMADLINA